MMEFTLNIYVCVAWLSVLGEGSFSPSVALAEVSSTFFPVNCGLSLGVFSCLLRGSKDKRYLMLCKESNVSFVILRYINKYVFS